MFKNINRLIVNSCDTGVLHHGCLAPCLFLRYPGYIADCIGFGWHSVVKTCWVISTLPFVVVDYNRHVLRLRNYSPCML